MGRFNLYTGISRERFFVKSYNKTDTDFTSNRPLHGNWVVHAPLQGKMP